MKIKPHQLPNQERYFSHCRQALGARSLKLCPPLVNLCPEMPLEPEPTHPRRHPGGSSPAWVPRAATPKPIVQQLPAPCVPCPRAGGMLHLPFTHTHTEPWLHKCSLPERYTSLLPAEKIPPGVLQRAHAAARNSHSSRGRRSSHGRRLSQSGWGARHPARHPLCTCAAPGAAPGALPGAAGTARRLWVSCLRLGSMVRLSKLTPAHLGPALGRTSVRRAPRAGQAPAAARGCAMETVCSSQGGWRGWPPPWLAGGERCCAGSHGHCSLWGHLSALQQVSPTAHPGLGLHIPAQFSWLGSPQSSGSLARSAHLH